MNNILDRLYIGRVFSLELSTDDKSVKFTSEIDKDFYETLDKKDMKSLIDSINNIYMSMAE